MNSGNGDREPAAAVAERVAHARELALRAGEAVLQRYGETERRLKTGGSPVTEADLASNRLIVAGLRERWPEDAILSEESKDSPARLGAERVWVVDPLDGTREFLKRNGEFAVMIGMLERGVPILGVVYAPARGVLYSAARGGGSWVERGGGPRERLRRAPADPSALRVVGSRSHPHPLLERMLARLGVGDVLAAGSVGIKCGLIAEGVRDLYIHPSPHIHEWDTCAPQVVLEEAGGAVRDCRGRELRYNKRVPTQPDGIVACAADVLDDVVARVRPVYEEARASAQ